MTYEEILCDANNLYAGYKASIKGSKWKESTQRFILNFLRYIFEVQDDLINRTLTNGPVDEFELHERGKIRPITSIPVKDRIVRHVLCDQLLVPKIRRKIIYDNCASLKGRGISMQRKRFEVHLRKYYKLYGNDGYILFGDFSKFYDNIIHEIAKQELLELFEDDEFIDWLLTVIFDGFKVDVSYMSDDEYASCLDEIFNKLEYRKIPKSKLTGEKFMEKSVNMGDQLSQAIGIYYPHRIYTMHRKLKKLAVKVENGEIPYENVEGMFKGWMGDFYKLMSRTQRKNLLELYEGLFNKTITIVKKKMIIKDRSEQESTWEVA